VPFKSWPCDYSGLLGSPCAYEYCSEWVEKGVLAYNSIRIATPIALMSGDSFIGGRRILKNE